MGCSPDANTRAVTLAGGWLGAVLVVELIEQSIPQPLDLPPELSHVQRFILRRQSLSRRGRDLARLDQALVRRLRPSYLRWIFPPARTFSASFIVG